MLGALTVSRDGEPVAVTAAKPRALLLALALRRGAVVAVDALVDALWGDRPPETAHRVVRVYVSQLRALLGADAIVTSGQGYRLAAHESDVRRVERLLADGRSALAGGNPALGAAIARRALAQWRGPSLAEVRDEAFAAAEAAHLDGVRLALEELHAEAALHLGRHAELVDNLAALVGEHPLHEPLHARLALALYRCGRQSDALHVLARLRDTLREELGLDPGEAVAALETAILRQDAALAGPTEPEARRAALPAPVALLGRTRELALLRQLVLRDDVRIVTISGAGGSGKTSVALAVAADAAADFANGAAFVELAPVTDADLVVPTVARALGVADTADLPVEEALAVWLAGRELLLVVDNVEHVSEAATSLHGWCAARRG